MGIDLKSLNIVTKTLQDNNVTEVISTAEEAVKIRRSDLGQTIKPISYKTLGMTEEAVRALQDNATGEEKKETKSSFGELSNLDAQTVKWLRELKQCIQRVNKTQERTLPKDIQMSKVQETVKMQAGLISPVPDIDGSSANDITRPTTISSAKASEEIKHSI